jgi:hypothetical protein
VTSRDLLIRAAECTKCAEEHKLRKVGTFQTWADPKDGHSYDPRLSLSCLNELRKLAAQ